MWGAHKGYSQTVKRSRTPSRGRDTHTSSGSQALNHTCTRTRTHARIHAVRTNISIALSRCIVLCINGSGDVMVHIRLFSQLCLYVYSSMYECVYRQMHAHTHTHTHTHTHRRTHTHMCGCFRCVCGTVCACVCVTRPFTGAHVARAATGGIHSSARGAWAAARARLRLCHRSVARVCTQARRSTIVRPPRRGLADLGTRP